MEDRSAALLHLELGDASAETCAERANVLARREGAERVTWWENEAFERTDLPMRVRDGRRLVVTEAREGYEPPPPAPDVSESHCFRPHPRPGRASSPAARPWGS
jgi:hypothetical protein